jgi:protein-tyrosine phosphatase
VISLLLCTTRRELDRHAYRLLLVQIVAIAFFIALPLRFSFQRPVADGVFGDLFAALTSFDKPFNQAPSLHIALLVIIWVRFAAHIQGPTRLVLHLWMALIALSVLTTYQHHFIDLPTGLALGFAALWILPEEEASPLRGWAMTRDAQRRRLALLYAAGAGACATVACLGGTSLWMFWPAVALTVVACIYDAIGPRGFQKRPGGRLSVGARVLLAPYLVIAWLNSRIWTRRHPQAVEVLDGVFIGRIPTVRELSESRFAAVIDLCAEVSCGDGGDRAYRCVPVLDLTVPQESDLREAARAIELGRERGPVLVCCALGYSRSAAAVVGWLLLTQRVRTVEKASALVRKVRPAMVLRDEHHAALATLI